MRWRVLIALAVLVGLTAFAPAPFLKPKKKPGQPRQMEGLWEQVTRNDVRPPGRGYLKQTIRIEPGMWSFELGGKIDRRAARATVYFLKVNPSATPPTFDLRRKEDDPQPAGRGIYELNGDGLRIAYSWSGIRPDDLYANKPSVVRFLLRRVTK
jgi:uncharacterized protein (TIGR03067 family)